MVYGDLQFFDIIIFAAIAVFIIYRLRSVLGKRTGFEKNIAQKELTKKEAKQPPKTYKTPCFIGFLVVYSPFFLLFLSLIHILFGDPFCS